MKRAAVAMLLAAACGDNVSRETCATDGEMCSHLSSWELFDDIASQQPAPGVIPYDLNTPLFSDYASKDRFVRLPEGMSATWTADGTLDLPVGSVLVKTFSYVHDRRDPSLGRRLLETRLLVHGETGWHGSSYVYNDSPDDAQIAIAGGTLDTTWIHDDGQTRTNKYVVPNQNQCKNCHAEHNDVVAPLGPRARHVQPERLQALIDAGELTGAPARDQWPTPIVALDYNGMTATGSLDERAREWLDINCSYCHNPTGAARTSGLYLNRDETDPAKWGVCKSPVATGRGSGGLQYDIVPGLPDASILVYRISSTEPEIRMPELGRNLVHEEGVALIREWITAMTGTCTGWTTGHGQAPSHPTTR
ncbi:MAG TPA: SO2930 family diheme c-type cytochrome [Kofleriaceae bacterium]|nr:SO2930 family diheme c-type cytochrome [Kofleriaceae bacterium]